VAPSTSAAAHSGAADGTSEKVVAEQVAAQELTAEERSVVTIGRGNPAVQARQGAVVDLVGPDSASKVVILAHAAKVTAVTAESFQVAIDPAQVVEVIGAQMAGALSVVLVSDPQR
jgi:ABC-type enterochelin transport system ATPase subunit